MSLPVGNLPTKKIKYLLLYHVFYILRAVSKQDTVVLWSKSSTLDRKVEGSNPAATHFSFEVDDLDAHKRKKMETKTGAPANDH